MKKGDFVLLQFGHNDAGAVNATSYDLVSLGRDGQPGGTGEDGDVTSWGESKP